MSHDKNNVTRFSLIAAFGGFVFGLDAANISGAIRFVSAQFNLNAMQQGLVVSCALLGVIVALFVTGTLVERFGRKRVLLWIALTYAASSIISSLALSFPMLVVGRFIGGVAFASLTVSAMYIGEIAPADRRGRFVSINQLLITLGSFVAFVTNYLLIRAMSGIDWLNEATVWRYMLGAELFVNVVWGLLLLRIPESPRWLLKKGRDAEAEATFVRLGVDDTRGVMASVKESFHHLGEMNVQAQIGLLLSKRLRLVLLVAVVYAVVQGGTGMNAVLFYAPVVFEQVGLGVQGAFLQTTLLGLVAVLFTLVAIFTVERFGRRQLTLLGVVLIAVAHLSTAYGFNTAEYEINDDVIAVLHSYDIHGQSVSSIAGQVYDTDVDLKRALAEVIPSEALPLVSGEVIKASIDMNAGFVMFGIFAFLAAFNMSVGPVMWVVFSEIFPNSVRSAALPFAALVQTVSSWTIQQFFPWQLEYLGAGMTFFVYAVVAVIGFGVLYLIMPETKQKSIEDIEQELVKD